MEKITILMETVNDAFCPTVDTETIRILRDLADKFENNGVRDLSILDINGNQVGVIITA